MGLEPKIFKHLYNYNLKAKRTFEIMWYYYKEKNALA